MCKKENNETRDYKHLHNDRLCYCCDELQDSTDDIVVLKLGDRGYGSSFDGSDSYIQLCKKCLKKEYIEWFNEKPTMVGYWENYKYEDNIRDLVNTFPLENQEYFWNSNCHGWIADIMERQDWLDMENGVMTDEKYKEYHMYSPSEIKAYEERFPTCAFPVNVVYSDGSKCSKCLCGAHGEYGQTTGLNISIECYNCKAYNKRINPIETVTQEIYEVLEREILGETTEEKCDRAIHNLIASNKIK